ncbi:hypothetical protein QBC36DRAFT_309606 [Triangularia setosa]|uniref:Uncharacterized protein n=1 Tax=Triangularia setosa TaxID=2587417 RepID=A0AAN6W9Y4_9PEZI|nr:hypothetical protein QBC36DRAFT_309606 [Podospora setosa]
MPQHERDRRTIGAEPQPRHQKKLRPKSEAAREVFPLGGQPAAFRKLRGPYPAHRNLSDALRCIHGVGLAPQLNSKAISGAVNIIGPLFTVSQRSPRPGRKRLVFASSNVTVPSVWDVGNEMLKNDEREWVAGALSLPNQHRRLYANRADQATPSSPSLALNIYWKRNSLFPQLMKLDFVAIIRFAPSTSRDSKNSINALFIHYATLHYCTSSSRMRQPRSVSIVHRGRQQISCLEVCAAVVPCAKLSFDWPLSSGLSLTTQPGEQFS